ncbi:serine hydrolase [Planosporangium thailandense]
MPVAAIVGAAVTVGLLLFALISPYRLVPISSTPARLASDAAAEAAGPQPLLRPRPVAFSTPGFHSWALLNTKTGKVSGSDNPTATSDTASMVKAWLASDYLRQAAQRGEKPTAARMRDLSIMIRDSDNDAAERVYRLNGSTASIQRLIRICGLTGTSAVPGLWSNTVMTAPDAVRMGACIADGRAAGPKWTRWILDEMRHVRGDGRFGIIEALPADVAASTAMKNGWLLRDDDGLWHVNCLAIGDGWVLAVMLRYPGSLGFAHGGAVCRSVATQLMTK